MKGRNISPAFDYWKSRALAVLKSILPSFSFKPRPNRTVAERKFKRWEMYHAINIHSSRSLIIIKHRVQHYVKAIINRAYIISVGRSHKSDLNRRSKLCRSIWRAPSYFILLIKSRRIKINFHCSGFRLMMRIVGHRRIQMNRDSPAGVSGKARRSRRRRFNRFLMMMIEASAQKSWKKKASWHYVRHHPSISPSISPARSSRAHKS